MQLLLSKQCESLTGSLGRGFGYFIQKRRNGFYGIRNRKGTVPPDGHWRFILSCAELAQSKLHLTDIRLSWQELEQALYEAHYFIAMQNLKKDSYNAQDIINLKTTFGL